MAHFSGKIINAYYTNPEQDTVCVMWSDGKIAREHYVVVDENDARVSDLYATSPPTLKLTATVAAGLSDVNVRESKQIVVSSNKKKYRELVEWKFQNQTSRSGNLRDIGLENIG